MSQECFRVGDCQYGPARRGVCGITSSAIQPNWSKLMKITVINKATTSKKPSNYCPWIMDESAKKD
jgi:hypothetical protein